MLKAYFEYPTAPPLSLRISYQCLSRLQLFLMVKLLYKTRSPFLGSQNARPVSEKTKESQMLDQRRLPRVNVEAFLRELGCNDGSP